MLMNCHIHSLYNFQSRLSIFCNDSEAATSFGKEGGTLGTQPVFDRGERRLSSFLLDDLYVSVCL